MTLHYIDIPETIKRFNEVCGLGYDFRVLEASYEPTGETTSSGKPTFRALVRGEITVYSTEGQRAIRGGVGSHTSHDVDMALKSAQAEAMKKSGHQFGVGLYLWDERERKLVDAVNAGSYKKAAGILMKIEGLSAAEAKEYGDAETFLKEYGLL